MNPISIFATATAAARFWFICFLITLAGCFISNIMIVQSMKEREKAIILDKAGVFTITPVDGLASSKELHQYIAGLATEALLNRGPDGPDNIPLLNQLYVKDGLKSAKEYVKTEAEEFDTYKIHQKCEIAQIAILTNDLDKAHANVTGQLIRNKAFKKEPITEVYTFSMNILLVRNANLKQNGKLPMVVSKFNIETKQAQVPNQTQGKNSK